jgi:Leucine-rich repeat (LRR) protein
MGATITSFTGLQNLTNIQEFKADFNSLTSINLSGMSTLTEVDLSDNDLPDSSTNSLSSVNLSGCTSLQFLYLDDNDFSEGIPDLSDCNSLKLVDFDQCGIVGSVDISNLPALEQFDFSGNLGLTELIISSSQPLGDNGRELLISDCALTQTAVDNILVTLASGSVSNGYIRLDNVDDTGTNPTPGEAGRESLFILNSRGWSFDVTFENHTELSLKNEALEADICASTYTITQYIVSGSSIEVGNKLYQNIGAWLPAEPGWYRLDGDGSIKFEVSGSKGEIISVNPCGA